MNTRRITISRVTWERLRRLDSPLGPRHWTREELPDGSVALDVEADIYAALIDRQRIAETLDEVIVRVILENRR